MSNIMSNMIKQRLFFKGNQHYTKTISFHISTTIEYKNKIIHNTQLNKY